MKLAKLAEGFWTMALLYIHFWADRLSINNHFGYMSSSVLSKILHVEIGYFYKGSRKPWILYALAFNGNVWIQYGCSLNKQSNNYIISSLANWFLKEMILFRPLTALPYLMQIVESTKRIWMVILVYCAPPWNDFVVFERVSFKFCRVFKYSTHKPQIEGQCV